jgi:predicted nucleic-acid-binding protein
VSTFVDTNILVRLLTRDDETQLRKAKLFVAENNCLVQTTVVLELEWILRSVHRYSREQIAKALNMLMETEGLEIEESMRLKSAVRGLADGLDFADSYHLAGATDAAAFATFDRNLAKRASRSFTKPPVIHP